MVLVDDVTAMIAARDEPEVVSIYEYSRRRAKLAEATLLDGGMSRVDRERAAFANAVAANWCELDEGYRVVGCHGGLYSVPAAIAEAESAGLAVEDLLRAIVIGYEVSARFARTFQLPARPRTVHPHSTFAAIGAAASVAALRGSSAAHFFNVLTTAATFTTVGPYTHVVNGALVQNAWAGMGAMAGFRANELAACGLTGLPGSPYEVFAEILGATPFLDELSQRLGEAWAIRDGYHKVHACCSYTHATVDAILDVRERIPAGAMTDKIAEIVVETHDLALNLDAIEPQTTLAARFSLPHIVATTLAHGHAGPEAFRGATLEDVNIGSMREKVRLRRYEPTMPPPNDRPARVSIFLSGGNTVVSECLSARGGPDRPWTEAAVLDKVARLTGEAYPAFPGMARRLLVADRKSLGRPWSDVLIELLGNEARGRCLV
jgi:2-methylcitrate dehydratase PrpD